MPKLVSSLKKISHISSFWKVLDVVTAVRNGSIILGACSLESAADTITVILNPFLISLLLFTTKKMPLNFWNGRNIKHCILRKKIQIEEHLCPLSSSNNNSHYNDGIDTWTTENNFLGSLWKCLIQGIYMNNNKLSRKSLSFLMIVKEQ